jgi:hypothetical protein
MTSRFDIPFPTEEHKLLRGCVYFYNDEWIPVLRCCLVDAIEIRRKVLESGKEFFVFPIDSNPSNLKQALGSTFIL